MSGVFVILCFHLFLSCTGALFGYLDISCHFTSDSSHHPVYVMEVIVNKALILEYNSTLEKCVGYTKLGKLTAEILNHNQHFINDEKRNAAICRYFPEFYDTIMQTVEPRAWVHSVEAKNGKHAAMLVCSVNNFYPKEIKVMWLRNGKNVTSGVTNTDVLADGNWLYQIHSFLEYTPKPGETITCVVDHASLDQPMLKNWERFSEPEKIKIAVGSFAILMGLGIFLAGLIYYKNKTGRTLVPTQM
ncbi:H-2 class II histocompatibility antigen, E-S beta chain-like isoform X1 [Synchiropus splendidus]|uniref:H-2 class II histocompatibility antigen, E-S beta chain-like isoform X1 n=2 Tax=Synchiropus splendidus TaxID=270530 RepID=UPI00237E8E8F|nr:H-2 class II histocompatibility antigen, E-S beta chain-like isoform X1 [Synchiropus splendidus]